MKLLNSNCRARLTLLEKIILIFELRVRITSKFSNSLQVSNALFVLTACKSPSVPSVSDLSISLSHCKGVMRTWWCRPAKGAHFLTKREHWTRNAGTCNMPPRVKRSAREPGSSSRWIPRLHSSSPYARTNFLLAAIVAIAALPACCSAYTAPHQQQLGEGEQPRALGASKSQYTCNQTAIGLVGWARRAISLHGTVILPSGAGCG